MEGEGGSDPLDTDVIIIGGGPVGLFMAAELSFWNINSVVIEKRKETSNSARAVFINSNTMEHMRRLGLEKRILENSYPRNQPVTITMGTSLLGKKPLLESHFSSWGDAIDGLEEKEMAMGFSKQDTAYPPIFCPQYTQERVLKEHLETRPNVKLYWGKMATSVEDDGSFVTVRLIDTDDLTTESVLKGRYMIACDGGRSWVRKQLNVHNIGQFVVRRACTYVFNSPETARQLQDAGILGFGFIFNERYVVVSIALNIEGDFAFHIIRSPNTSDEVMNEMCLNAEEHVRFIIGKDIPFTIKDAHDYNMHALIATKYREGRIFFAGDAAHQWLPVGGLGLNTGYQDASDLGWKMAAVIKGWGGPHLLDSFQIERRPIADKTRRLALAFAPPSLDPVPMKVFGTILRHSPVPRLILYLFGGKILQSVFAYNKDIVLGNQYTESNIVLHEFEDESKKKIKTPHEVGKFSKSCLPGSRAPHVVIPESRSIHDIFGKGFVLLIIGGKETDCEALQTSLKNRNVPFGVFTYPKLPELVDLYDCKYYLIRPDGIIAWRSHSQPSNHQTQIIVKTICGNLPFHSLKKSPIEEESSASFSFLRSIEYGLLGTFLARKYTAMSQIEAIGIGLGVATLTTVLEGSAKPVVFPQKISRHQAWKITKFGSAESVLQLDSKYLRDFGPKDVLIKVYAASISRSDIQLRRGFNRHELTLGKKNNTLFPIVLGRDCSGEVVAVGDEVYGFIPGDMVYAACPLSSLGTHAQYASINKNYVSLKPVNINHCQAASLPWVAVTTWTAVVNDAGLTEHTTRCKKVLVHGGSGGIGSFAIQMLKSWGAEVTTTCSKENIPFVHNLGADMAVDYRAGNFSELLSKHSYDFVLDTVGLTQKYESPSLSLLKLYSDAKYVSLISPRSFLINKFGSFLGGFLFQWYYRYKIIINRLLGGRGFYYSSAEPDGKALSMVKEMVEVGDIHPCLAAVYSVEEMIDAHQHLESGSTCGKVVVSFV